MKVVGLGLFVVGFVVGYELSLAPTTSHFQHHLDCFLALERPEITIEALAWL